VVGCYHLTVLRLRFGPHRSSYQRQDGCRCDFATDIIAVEGMSGSPVISSDGEVLGILTLAGNGKFRGLSFGVSCEEAKSFLAAEGVIVAGGIRGSRAVERNWAASSSAKTGGREAHDTFCPICLFSARQ